MLLFVFFLLRGNLWVTLQTLTIKVEEYLTEEGKNHYREWFEGLSVEYAAKVAAARARMVAGSLGNVKPIDGSQRVSD